MIINSRIIKLIKAKDEETFEKIYYEYYKLIYYIGLTITKNQDLASEVVQDTFLRMLSSIDTYCEKGKFKQWLCQIARNISLNKVERSKTNNIIFDEETIKNLKSPNDDNIMLVLTINESLPTQDAQIVIYKIVYNLNFREISELLDLSIGTVQSHYYHSLDILREVFK